MQSEGTYALITPPEEDNGLGFMQGSTDGVVNTYGKRGFHRPGAPESSREERDHFNLRDRQYGCRNFFESPYACHYDPSPPTPMEQPPVIPAPEEPNAWKELRVFVLLMAVLLLWWSFGQRS